MTVFTTLRNQVANRLANRSKDQKACDLNFLKTLKQARNVSEDEDDSGLKQARLKGHERNYFDSDYRQTYIQTYELA